MRWFLELFYHHIFIFKSRGQLLSTWFELKIWDILYLTIAVIKWLHFMVKIYKIQHKMINTKLVIMCVLSRIPDVMFPFLCKYSNNRFLWRKAYIYLYSEWMTTLYLAWPWNIPFGWPLNVSHTHLRRPLDDLWLPQMKWSIRALQLYV